MAAISRPSSAEVDCRAGLSRLVVGEDGHVLDRHEFWCATEEEAKERARQLLDGRDVELWHRDQMIAIFNHKTN